METNTIICADALKAIGNIGDETVDLVVTDPPYLVNYKDRHGRKIANDDNPEAVLSIYKDLFRVLKQNSYCISFYGWTALAAFSKAWEEAGFRICGRIVWTKKYASRTYHARHQHEAAIILVKGKPPKPEEPISDVQSWIYTGNRSHPTEKAVGVMAPLVKGFSKPGALVLDPFSGTGATAVAAALNGRRYIGMELEKRYCEIAEQRLAGVHRKMKQTAAA